MISSGIEQGLFTSSIRKIIEDKNGYLWIATQDGLSKYDGNTTEQFSKNNNLTKKKLLGSDCFLMEYKMEENYLYVLSSYEGLNIININTNEVEFRISSDKLIGSPKPTFYNHMVRAGENLVITTNDNKFVILNTLTKKIIKSGDIEIPSKILIKAIFEYKKAIVVLLSNNTIRYFENKDFALIEQKNIAVNLSEIVVNKCVVFKDCLLLATNKGTYAVRLEDGSRQNIVSLFQAFPLSKLNDYASCIEIMDGSLFLATVNGVFVYNIKLNKTSELYSNKVENDENFLRSVQAMFLTKSQLWIGGPYGVSQLKNLVPIFSSYNKTNDAAIKVGQAYGMKSNKEEGVFIASENGLYNLKNNSLKRLIANQPFLNIGELDNNQFLFSGINDLFIYKNKKLFSADVLYKELKQLKGDAFISIERFGKNKILMASQFSKGVYLWDMSLHTLTLYNAQSNLPITDLKINRIWIKNEDSVFIISETVIQLANFKKNEIKTIFNLTQLGEERSGVFMDMCQQGKDYWVSIYGFGIINLNEKFKLIEIINSKNGIINLGIYKIFNACDSFIVATSNKGLIFYNTLQKKLLYRFEDDGLQSSSFNEASGCEYGDSIFIGGLNGFSLFNTGKFKINKESPRLYFNTVSWDSSNTIIDTSNLYIQKCVIPNVATQTKITFGAINLINPKRIIYWYRINGLQDKWQALQNQNFISLIGIEPGDYTLEVKAANEDGIESKPISMQLQFLPKWYQTWLFKVLIWIFILVIIYFIYDFRIKQLKNIIEIRQKIASDLHDDIGSTLTGIRIFTELAIKTKSNEYLQQVKNGILDATTALKDTIWMMDKENSNAKQLTKKVDDFISQLAKANQLNFEIHEEKGISDIYCNPDERRNLYLIIKEFINNSLKYANCKNIILSVEKYGKKIKITIMDDGCGFDILSAKRGNGINNIFKRASDISYNALFTSNENGTRLDIFPKNKK